MTKHCHVPLTEQRLCLVKLALEWSLLCKPRLELCDLPLQLLHHCLVAGHVVVHRQHIADHLHTSGGEEGEGALQSDKLRTYTHLDT